MSAMVEDGWVVGGGDVQHEILSFRNITFSKWSMVDIDKTLLSVKGKCIFYDLEEICINIYLKVVNLK